MKGLDVIGRLREDVTALTTAGTREVGTRGHASARSYIVGRMAEVGLEPYADGFEIPYEVGGRSFVNLAGLLPGSSPGLAPVLLGAHYDTVPGCPGADDNGAAIAGLLAATEALRGAELERTVLVAFFDAEEPPYFLSPAMGSIHFHARQCVTPVHCAIILDLIGHDVPVGSLEDSVFMTGMESAAGLQEVIRDGAGDYPLPVVPTLNRYVGDLSDHHVFRISGEPYLFLSCGRWAHYHMPSDTVERVNFTKVSSVTELVVLLTEFVSRQALDVSQGEVDTTATELHFLRKHLGPLQAMFEFDLESREDIDNLAALLLQKFGV